MVLSSITTLVWKLIYIHVQNEDQTQHLEHYQHQKNIYMRTWRYQKSQNPEGVLMLPLLYGISCKDGCPFQKYYRNISSVETFTRNTHNTIVLTAWWWRCIGQKLPIPLFKIGVAFAGQRNPQNDGSAEIFTCILKQ